jgi:hypothetical protein
VGPAKNIQPRRVTQVFSLTLSRIHLWTYQSARVTLPLWGNITREGAYDSLREVINMNYPENWIPEEQLSPSSGFKVISKTDPNHGLSEDEIQDRNEYIRCYLLKDFWLLMTIPKQATEDDFFIPDCNVSNADYSAFNTVDFQRTQRPFNKYAYAMKKIMERVKELAIMHSSISDEDGRLATYQRYEALVDREFRHRLLTMADRHKRQADEEKRYWMRRKIAELNQRILECKRIWALYAPPENWDR